MRKVTTPMMTACHRSGDFRMASEMPTAKASILVAMPNPHSVRKRSGSNRLSSSFSRVLS